MIGLLTNCASNNGSVWEIGGESDWSEWVSETRSFGAREEDIRTITPMFSSRMRFERSLVMISQWGRVIKDDLPGGTWQFTL